MQIADKMYAVGSFFRPSSPIQEKELFSGRIEQMRTVINAILQTGQHVVMYGERGVGKTSLANVIHAHLPKAGRIVPVKLNCDGNMDFKSLFQQIFSEINVQITEPGMGFNATDTTRITNLSDTLKEGQDITPNFLRHLFTGLGAKVIIILDEFDRITDADTKRLLSDVIKNFSDYSVDTTFIFVGVADSVDALISEHQSIERALVQVKLPRMSRIELQKIIVTGMEKLVMGMEEEVINEIVKLSQGLPHYTHLLSLHATQNAILHERNIVDQTDLKAAINESVNKAQQSVKDDYFRAVQSPRGNLYKQVLLACALVEKDELGFFSAADIREPLRVVTGKTYQIAAYAKHLKGFCSSDRGPVIEQRGYERRYRYRFTNPIMEPFVILDGKAKGLIK